MRVYPGDRADLVANVRQSGDPRAADIDATLQVETLGVDATRTLALAPRGQTTLPCGSRRSITVFARRPMADRKR